MKILLVNPPRSPENNILLYAPADARSYIHRKLIGPPLGLLTVAAAVEDHDVTVLDLKGEYDLSPDVPALDELIERHLSEIQPDIVGITTITSEFNATIEIVKICKLFNPDILTVTGGLHATLRPFDFENSQVDVIISGQNPHLFREVVRAREGRKNLKTVPGLYINTADGLIQTKGKPPVWDTAKINFLTPDRNHLKRWIGTYKVGNNPDPTTYLFTSLGCPYKCTFCSIWTQFKGCYYQRDIDSLIGELKSIDEYPVVRFADANTLVDIPFMNQLFDRIHSEGIRKTFVMDIRADVAAKNPDLINKMARGGLKVVICGFESFRDEELERYHKKTLASYNREAIQVFDGNGILVRGNYVVPCDYTMDDFKALADYANENKVVYAGYTILSPMPGTLYYQEVRKNIRDHNYDRYNFFNALLQTTLPYEDFHREVAKLWLIKRGTDII